MKCAYCGRGDAPHADGNCNGCGAPRPSGYGDLSALQNLMYAGQYNNPYMNANLLNGYQHGYDSLRNILGDWP